MMLIAFILLISIETSQISTDGYRYIPLHISDNSVEETRTHRAPAVIPIMAYYDGQTNTVSLHFQYDCGYAQIITTNATSGESVIYSIDTRSYNSMSVSETPGLYHIRILLPDGRTYCGVFNVM